MFRFPAGNGADNCAEIYVTFWAILFIFAGPKVLQALVTARVVLSACFIGLAAWKAPSTPTLPEFGAFNESLGYDKSAVHNSRLVCTSRECAHIAAFFASNLNEKVSAKGKGPAIN